MIRKGYVYLIQSVTGLWKIGRTSNPEDRIKTFKLKLPFEVEFAHIIPCYDMYKLESELHQHFQHKRQQGEWFALTDVDVKAIKRIQAQVDFDFGVMLEAEFETEKPTPEIAPFPITPVLSRIFIIVLLSIVMTASLIIAVVLPSLRYDYLTYVCIAGVGILVNTLDILNALAANSRSRS